MRTWVGYDAQEIVPRKYTFTEEDKMSIVSGYVMGGRPVQEIAEKYHLSSCQIIFNRMDKYVNERGIVFLLSTK